MSFWAHKTWAVHASLDSRATWDLKVRRMWQVTPSASLNLLWRLTEDVLLVRASPSKWSEITPLCPRCRRQVETLFHVFLECPSVTPIWHKMVGTKDMHMYMFVRKTMEELARY